MQNKLTGYNGGLERDKSLITRFFAKICKYDLLQIFAIVSLLMIGVFFIWSGGRQVGTALAAGFWLKQLLWIAFGLVLWFCFSMLDTRILRFGSLFFYLMVIALLVMVLFVAPRVYGSRRWLFLGSMRLQPSELAKLACIFLSSSVISMRRFKVNNLLHLSVVFLIFAVPFVLILVEPDLGSALVLLPILVFPLFVAGLSWRYIITGGLLAILTGTAGIANEYYQVKPVLKKYQRERIMVFLDPKRDTTNRGYNQLQSKLAVGSGGMHGKGLGNGTQNTLGFLPSSVSNNDFIFSVIAEESGFIGASVVIALYLLLLYSILATARIAKSKFDRLCCVGIAAMFFTHSIVNMSMCIGLLPVTGLSLPLISYGGSFMVCSLVALGIVQRIHYRAKRSGR